MTQAHRRWLYVALILVNIPVGLATRRYGQHMPALIAEYGGDALYASCLFFVMRLLLIQRNLWTVAIRTYLICVLIELQQLYQAPWAIKFRNIPLVGLILGHGFLWSDLVCYAVGVLIGWGLAVLIESYQLPIKNSNRYKS